MASFDGLRDWWEHRQPREKRMVALLGATAVVCIFGFVGFTISDGLDAIAAKNEQTREALVSLDVHRTKMALPKDASLEVEIGDEAPPLATYIESIATELDVTIPSYSPQPTVQRGKYDEKSMNIELRDVSIDVLAQFLEKLETNSKIVVVTSLQIEKSFRQPELLRRAAMTVSTFEKTKKAGQGSEG